MSLQHDLRQPSEEVRYGSWVDVLGDGSTSYKVYLSAWATETHGELLVFPDQSMAYSIARFALGKLDTTIIVTENVICIRTPEDMCAFRCDTKQQQREWLRILRFPILSPLPINDSRDLVWDGYYDNTNHQFSSTMKGSTGSQSVSSSRELRSFYDARAQVILQQTQEKNNKKRTQREEVMRKEKKKREAIHRKVLARHRERMIREGREDELNWTKSTLNMYKNLGVKVPSLVQNSPSQYSQPRETTRERAARLSREAATSYILSKEKLNESVILKMRDIQEEKHKQYQDEKTLQVQSKSENGIDLTQEVRLHLSNSPIKYRNALANMKEEGYQLNACVTIQRCWRGFACRLKRARQVENLAALSIQKIWLLSVYRSIMKENFRRLLENHKHLKNLRSNSQTESCEVNKEHVIKPLNESTGTDESERVTEHNASYFDDPCTKKSNISSYSCHDNDVQTKSSVSNQEPLLTSSLENVSVERTHINEIGDGERSDECIQAMCLPDSSKSDDTLNRGSIDGASRSSAIPRFQDAVKKVIERNAILDIFEIDNQDEEYTDEIHPREPCPPPKVFRPSVSSPNSGKSFRRILSL